MTPEEIAAAVTATRRTMRIAGHIVPIANVPPSMASEAGRLLCERTMETPNYDFRMTGDTKWCSPYFAATYYDGADGRRHFSLFSPEGGADVGEIARKIAEKFNNVARGHAFDKYAPFDPKAEWIASGTSHFATFDAPLGWEGE